MFNKLIALFLVFAAANAGVVVYPATKIENVPVAKTSIVGPSGNITKEENLPFITEQSGALVESPVFRLNDVPLVQGSLVPSQVSFPQTGSVVPVQTLPVVQPQVPVFVNQQIPIVKSLPNIPLLIKGVPFVAPLVNSYSVYPYSFAHGVHYA